MEEKGYAKDKQEKKEKKPNGLCRSMADAGCPSQSLLSVRVVFSFDER